MQKKLLLSALALITAISVSAQFNYTFTTSTDTYTPITGGTSINGSTIWDDEEFTIPLGFNFNMDGMINDTVYLAEDNFLTIDSVSPLNLFIFTDMDLIDRGNIDGIATGSPISYVVSGTAPNRVFKLEIANAGIYEEYDLYGTNNDSVNIQVWLYESSNIVELRYGPSRLSHPSDYHYLNGKAITGYIKGMNMSMGSFQKAYLLNGNNTSPAIDSTTDIDTYTGGMNAYPTNGTVYRFTPIPSGIVKTAGTLPGLQLLSNVGHSQILLNNPNDGTLNYKIVAINGADLYNSGSLQKGINHIDISYLPQGMHILYIAGKDGTQSYRINKL
jgi:hypothetical protein